MEEVMLNFSDFQRMLLENSAKPIWKKESDNYRLMWTSGSFLYYTQAPFTLIYYSYRKQTGKEDAVIEEALKAFEKKYLSDCLEAVSKVTDKEIDMLPVSSVSERKGTPALEHSVKFKKVDGIEKAEEGSLKIDNNLITGGKIIKGKNKEGKEVVVGILEG